MTLDGANEDEFEYGDTPKDEDLMGSLFVSDDGEIRCQASWDWDESLPAGWEVVRVPEAVATGILRLIRERDLARSHAASWEQTCRELHARAASHG